MSIKVEVLCALVLYAAMIVVISAQWIPLLPPGVKTVNIKMNMTQVSLYSSSNGSNFQFNRGWEVEEFIAVGGADGVPAMSYFARSGWNSNELWDQQWRFAMPNGSIAIYDVNTGNNGKCFTQLIPHEEFTGPICTGFTSTAVNGSTLWMYPCIDNGVPAGYVTSSVVRFLVSSAGLLQEVEVTGTEFDPTGTFAGYSSYSIVWELISSVATIPANAFVPPSNCQNYPTGEKRLLMPEIRQGLRKRLQRP